MEESNFKDDRQIFLELRMESDSSSHVPSFLNGNIDYPYLRKLNPLVAGRDVKRDLSQRNKGGREKGS